MVAAGTLALDRLVTHRVGLDAVVELASAAPQPGETKVMVVP